MRLFFELRNPSRIERAVFFLTFFALFSFPTFVPQSEAGGGLCKRMHSCASTDGSYVCGDKGYCSKCADNQYCKGGKTLEEAAKEAAKQLTKNLTKNKSKGGSLTSSSGAASSFDTSGSGGSASGSMDEGFEKMGEAMGEAMGEGMKQMGKAMEEGLKGFGEGLGEIMELAAKNTPDPDKASYASKEEEVGAMVKGYLLGIFLGCNAEFIMDKAETCVKEDLNMTDEGKEKFVDYDFQVDPTRNTRTDLLIRGYHKTIGEVWEIDQTGKPSLKKSANQERG